MAFRTRRFRGKPRVTWLPNTGAPPIWDAERAIFPNFLVGTLKATSQTADGFSTVIHRLTADYDAESTGTPIDQTNNSLADYTQNAWRLRRIVGKFFATLDVGEVTTCLVHAGFMVLRVDRNGSPLSIPSTDGTNSYAISRWGSERDPWIWRRSWLLGSGNLFFTGGYPAGATVEQNAWAQHPPSNSWYGSVQDGPHIDCKTARVIGPEESLFFIATAFVSQGPSFTTEPRWSSSVSDIPRVRWLLDYRLLGSPRRASNRRNASR